MASRRLYPEPINTVLKYSFFILCYLGRLWYFSKPLPHEVDDIKDWTHSTYEMYSNAIVNFFDIDCKEKIKNDPFKTLDEMMIEGNRVDKYEHLHRIRWKRTDDRVAYNRAKSLGFWIVLLQHLQADF